MSSSTPLCAKCGKYPATRKDRASGNKYCGYHHPATRDTIARSREQRRNEPYPQNNRVRNANSRSTSSSRNQNSICIANPCAGINVSGKACQCNSTRTVHDPLTGTVRFLCTRHFNLYETHTNAPREVCLEDDCAICYSALGSFILSDLICGKTTTETYGVTQLNCGHTFHAKCIHHWHNCGNENSQNCPTCRQRSGVSRGGAVVSSEMVQKYVEDWAGKPIEVAV